MPEMWSPHFPAPGNGRAASHGQALPAPPGCSSPAPAALHVSQSDQFPAATLRSPSPAPGTPWPPTPRPGTPDAPGQPAPPRPHRRLRPLTCVSALSTLILWVEMKRSTSVSVCASPSECCGRGHREGGSRWAEPARPPSPGGAARPRGAAVGGRADGAQSASCRVRSAERASGRGGGASRRLSAASESRRPHPRSRPQPTWPPQGTVRAPGCFLDSDPGRNRPRRWVKTSAFSSDGNRHRHSPPAPSRLGSVFQKPRGQHNPERPAKRPACVLPSP